MGKKWENEKLKKNMDVYLYRYCPYCESKWVYNTGSYWECKTCKKKWKKS